VIEEKDDPLRHLDDRLYEICVTPVTNETLLPVTWTSVGHAAILGTGLLQQAQPTQTPLSSVLDHRIEAVESVEDVGEETLLDEAGTSTAMTGIATMTHETACQIVLTARAVDRLFAATAISETIESLTGENGSCRESMIPTLDLQALPNRDYVLLTRTVDLGRRIHAMFRGHPQDRHHIPRIMHLPRTG
jgi:hypothetical protein